jgi:hypothetical protein
MAARYNCAMRIRSAQQGEREALEDLQRRASIEGPL